jgi:hydrogenase-4 component J
MSPDAASKVVFYQLGQKFLDEKDAAPADAKQVVYYSLAIGHHVGVIDCLRPILDCPLDEFAAWIGRWPEGAARSKLEGLLRFGEITIDASHTHMLATAISQSPADLSPQESRCAESLMQALRAIEAEPAIYLIGRRR